MNIDYKPGLLLKNKHLNTISANLLRSVKQPSYSRKRIITSDADFIDLDFIFCNKSTLVIIINGLEGSSDSTYAKGFVNALEAENTDVCVLNMRGCSGEVNKLYSSYHSGKTEDLDFILQHINDNYNYTRIHLVGFSIGGNVVMKFLGEQHTTTDLIHSAVGVSVPCDLAATAANLTRFSNKAYLNRLLKSLKSKLIVKFNRSENFPLTLEQINSFNDFLVLDEIYTAPAHGFKSVKEYWHINSSISFIKDIKPPFLLINALDDPFLSRESFPYDPARQNKNFLFETPRYGGHVGFYRFGAKLNPMWHECRIISFLGIDG